ncbi:MAG: EMC3/TMCO1 family protein [Nanoarchaeota archaeon]
MVFEHLLDPVFSPLLNLPTLLAVIILSFLISLLVTVVYKFTTDQNLMRDLKQEMKDFQKQIKELRNEPQKAREAQKKAMQTNLKYMSHSMKSTLYSILPIIIIFSWMDANFAYEPILPEQEFTTTAYFEKGYSGNIELSAPKGIVISGNAAKEASDGAVKWVLKGEEGEYLLEYIYDGKKQTKEVLISKNRYIEPIKNVNDGLVKNIEVEHKEKKLLNLYIFGWELGWLWTYIIFSIISSIVIRKVIKVY